ncbi:MAG: hypothetical protein KF883_11380 [Thermomicrobiales bacterium]|nr:hypothetical protein [Thermomicrobiales bacterium]
MIDPNWELVDLDPRTWRAIGQYFPPGQYIRAGSPDEHGLFVLHERGDVLNIVDSQSGRRGDLGIESVSDPSALANELHARGEWDRVHVIDRAHLQSVAATAQDATGRTLQLDQYYRRVAELVWGDGEGYVAVPPKERSWNGWTYEGIEAIVLQIQEPASVALAVIGDDGLVIGLIAEISDGMIRKVTTFDAFPAELRPGEISLPALDRVWRQLSDRFSPPAVVMLCSPALFDRWVCGPEKRRTIEAALEVGEAVVRQRDWAPLFPGMATPV